MTTTPIRPEPCYPAISDACHHWMRDPYDPRQFRCTHCNRIFVPS